MNKDNIGDELFVPAQSCVTGSTYDAVLAKIGCIVFNHVDSAVSYQVLDRVYYNVCGSINPIIRRRIANEQR